MKLTHNYADLDGCKLHYVEANAGSHELQTIVFLHGFPEYWGSWKLQLDAFSEKYRVVAPDLLGYNLSDKPKDLGPYEVPQLIQLMRKFIQHIAESKPIILVAHDWGGAIAWPLAAFHPELVSKLVILNAAHPSTFTREMINNPEQRLKSEYIHQLIAKDAEAHLSKNDFKFFKDMLFEHRLDQGFDDQQKQVYLNVWKQPDAITGMLNYYRSMPQLAPQQSQDLIDSGPLTTIEKMKIPQIRIKQPTLVLWSEQDQAFVSGILHGIEDYVPDLKVIRFADASHWLHHEQPEQVNQAIADFICE